RTHGSLYQSHPHTDHRRSPPTRRSSDLEAKRFQCPRCKKPIELIEVDPKARRISSCDMVAICRKMATMSQLEMRRALGATSISRSEEHTSELQSREKLVCRLLLEKTKTQ